VCRKRADMTRNGDCMSLKSAARSGYLSHCTRHLGDSGAAGDLVNAVRRLMQRRRAVMQRGGYLRYSARHLWHLRYLYELVISRGVLAGRQLQVRHRVLYITIVFTESRPAIAEPHLKRCT